MLDKCLAAGSAAWPHRRGELELGCKNSRRNARPAYR